ncbi:PH domain-containing protein [Actinacidiphila alni]|uniref:PH domain-containing protein n=1 Tax=Actinacidiphila alni TaxID=380248 RepID=A0A1I2DSE5_9ACTN|nr:PH domain-containing protein [Actinacidiphila alni]SFE83542.1 PH domain-containing protein [Actinacidiphila alni]
MTSSNDRPPARATAEPARPQYADRVYRSTAGVCGGVLLLVLAGWLGGDAVVNGSGHAPWLALATLLLVVPLIVAFTLRPAVYAGEERIRIRNPFRTITLPWSAVDSLRASFSNELFSGDKKYQLWAIPVSLRARKRAARQDARAKAAGDDPFGMPVRRRPTPSLSGDGTIRSTSDQAIEDLRELRERHGGDGDAGGVGAADGEGGRQGTTIRWAYEVIAPAVAGLVVLVVLLAVGG